MTFSAGDSIMGSQSGRDARSKYGRFKMARILICDDEALIRSMIAKYAIFEQHETDEAANGMEALEMCARSGYDLVIMDIMMPELDGFSTVREIRKHSDVPVIFLSARGEEYDKINGFESGGDDYVVKPFSPKELMLRVDAILRRRGGADGAAREEFSIGPLRCDMTGRIVYVNGERVDMTPKEYDLLFYMIRNKNIALSREKLISEVWGYDYYGDDRTLDTHIKLLRRSLGDAAKYIVTLRGVGYRFDTNE